jgi:hypothetical protein
MSDEGSSTHNSFRPIIRKANVKFARTPAQTALKTLLNFEKLNTVGEPILMKTLFDLSYTDLPTIKNVSADGK